MSVMRIGGLASGFDTDKMVKDLMRVERLKVDRLFQQRQTLTWQKEQYRGIINKVRVFRDTYFDVLKPNSNLMSSNTLKKMTATSSHTDVVTVTASGDAATGESTFQVLQSATSAKAMIGGITQNSNDGSRLALSNTMEAVSAKLQNGAFVFNDNGQFTLTVNNAEILVSKTDTLQTVLQKINNSAAGVLASYSTFSDTLTLTARNTGAGTITTDDGGNFFSAFGFNPNEAGEIGTAGRDAIFEIDGFLGTRSSNTFTIEGKTYSINKQIDEGDLSPLVSVKTQLDVEGIYKTIESFVNDYNSFIDTINAKISEESFPDFKPLTDEQKEVMSDREIEKWEEKAQSGLLRRDSSLTTMLLNLRQAIYAMVGEYNITQVGIETSNNYRDQGKLVLKNGGNDLKEAIAANPDMVQNIFARSSSISYNASLTAEQRNQRYMESGMASRMSDVLNDNIRTIRDSNGKKGILLERAGVVGDLSEFQNFYDKQIFGMNKQIDRMNLLLKNKESLYYKKFSSMESALQKLYSQGDWLASQIQSRLQN